MGWYGYDEHCLLGCDVVFSGTSLQTFRRNVLPPYLGPNRTFDFSDYSSALKMEAVYSSERFVNFNQTTHSSELQFELLFLVAYA
jgi:hypothetical protein